MIILLGIGWERFDTYSSGGISWAAILDGICPCLILVPRQPATLSACTVSVVEAGKEMHGMYRRAECWVVWHLPTYKSRHLDFAILYTGHYSIPPTHAMIVPLLLGQYYCYQCYNYVKINALDFKCCYLEVMSYFVFIHLGKTLLSHFDYQGSLSFHNKIADRKQLIKFELYIFCVVNIEPRI